MDDDITGPVFPGGSWFSTSDHLITARQSNHSENEEQNNSNIESVDWLSRIFISFFMLEMKVTPCLQTVLNRFQDAEVKFFTATPSMLADFLRMLAGNWSFPLEQTKLQSESRVADLLKFLTRNVGPQIELEGVPLLLCSDNMLRCFSAKNPVMLEMDEIVIKLFRRSLNRFASKDIGCILKAYDIQLRNYSRRDETLSELTVTDLAEMATIELREIGLKPLSQSKIFSSEAEFAIPKKWLKMFWSFAHRIIADRAKVGQFMQFFGSWPLIPARKSPGGPLLLFRTDQAPILVNIDLWKNISTTIFLKGLPIVEKEYFQTDTWNEFLEMFAGASAPERMLGALTYWDDLRWPTDNSQYKEVALGILKFFIPLSRKQLIPLRKLKIFESIYGEFLALNDRLAFTLDGGENVPKVGQETWISQAVFLKNHEILQPLYQKIQISNGTLARLYSKFIVPSLHKMNPNEQIEHLHFLFSNSQESWVRQPIGLLKQAKFLLVGSERKALQELSDRSVSLFEEIHGEEKFIPAEFQTTTTLLPFLGELGLRFMPTVSEYNNLAKQIPNLPLVARQLLESVATNVNLPGSAWQRCIEKLNMIEFIPCKPVHSDLEELCPIPFEIGSITMIRAKGKCISTWQLSQTLGSCNTHHLIWTASQSLPPWFPPELYAKMRICQLPSIELVLKHFKKLFQYLYERKLKPESYSSADVNKQHLRKKLKEILLNFYTFLQENIVKYNFSIPEMPMIFLEKGYGLAFPNMTVERLPDHLGGCISPFLYELPVEFHRHRSLFKGLGMEENASAQFMKMVVKYFKDNASGMVVWDAKLLLSVVLAQNAIVIAGAKLGNWETVDELYLLGSDQKLHKSRDLIFEDDLSISGLLSKTGMVYWWFPDLNLQCEEASVKDKHYFLEKLPNRLKMNKISHMMSKCVSSNSVECAYDELCPGASNLENVFRSPEFRKSIWKLNSAENRQMDRKKNTIRETIAKFLNNVQIKCYSTLKIGLHQAAEHCQSQYTSTSENEVQAFMTVDGKVFNISHTDANRIPKSEAFVYRLCQILRPFLQLNHSEFGLTKLLMCSDVSEFQDALNWLDVDIDQMDCEVGGASAPDPEIADMAVKYLKTANRDLRAAVAVRNCKANGESRIGCEHVIILAQQAAEKALKAVLMHQGFCERM